MTSRILFASFLVACWLAVVLLGFVAVANAASAGPAFVKLGQSARNGAGNYVIQVKRGAPGRRFAVPIAPSYSGYDYPYYYSRGYFPTHIRPGYIYYGYPYSYYIRSYNARYGARCSYGDRRCAAKWGYARSLRRQRANRN
jgi:hypothetical protein